jgi:hypothetical protein
MSDDEVVQACDGGQPFDTCEHDGSIDCCSIERRSVGSKTIAETVCRNSSTQVQGD